MSEFDFSAFIELDKSDTGKGKVIDLNFNTFKNIDTNNEETDLKHNWQLCENCNVDAMYQDFSLICPKCGAEIQNIDSSSENYSFSKKSTDITKIDGKNSYTYNKSLRTTCSNYPEWNKTKSVKRLNKFSYESKSEKTPDYINQRVIELFENIRKVKTFRGTGQNRILAAIVYYILQEEGMARQPRAIAELHGISEKDLSKGDSIVRQYLEENVIDISINNDNHRNFVDKYLAILDINPHKYKNIIMDIINRSEYKKIYRTKTPKPSTKCVGAIYLIIRSDPKLKKKITKEIIVLKCSISKSTFISNFHLLVANKSKFKKVYAKYKKKLNLTFPSN
jgi:transcription initiation factor TFIIIB Brf1 subunit/transcription initiation factor TFIIB